MGGFDAAGTPLETTRNQANRDRDGRRGQWNQLHTFPQTRCAPQLTDTEAALLRSQAGPMASAALQEGIPVGTTVFSPPLPPPSQAPIAFVCPFLPVWPSSRRPWPPPCSVRDSRGVGASRLGLGERVRVNVFVRDMDLHDFNRLDGRRLRRVTALEWRTAGHDTTMVSPVRRDGTARAGTATTNGKAFREKPEGEEIP